MEEKKEKLRKILIDKLGLEDLRLLRLRGHTHLDKTYKHSSAETNDKEMSKQIQKTEQSKFRITLFEN